MPVIQRRLGLVDLAPFAPLPDAGGRQLRSLTIKLSGGERPGSANAFAIWKDFLFTLYSPDNGGSLAQNRIRIAQNHWTVYAPDEPVDVNASVRRVAPADPRARAARRLTKVPRIAGVPRVPVLTLHGLGDLFVPFSMEQIYASDVGRRRGADLLVQRAIRSADHCEFTPSEVGTAWDDLTDWVESKRGRGHAHDAHADAEAASGAGRGGGHHGSWTPVPRPPGRRRRARRWHGRGGDVRLPLHRPRRLREAGGLRHPRFLRALSRLSPRDPAGPRSGCGRTGPDRSVGQDLPARGCPRGVHCGLMNHHNEGSMTMAGIGRIASKFLGGKGRAGGGGPAAGGRKPAGSAGGTGNSTDAAIGRGVRGFVSKLRR